MERKTHCQVCNPVKHFKRSMLSRVKDIPMVNRRLSDQANACITVPLPEDDIFRHDRRLKLLLCLEVKDLDGLTLGFEGDNVLTPVHDGTIGINWSPDDLIVVFKIDYDNLRLIIIVDLLSYTDEIIGF